MRKSRPKKQHFVPRFYLERFAGNDPDGKVWTYDTQEDRVFARAPKQTAVETNLYSIKTAEGEHRDEIEHWLAEIEGKAANIYNNVLDGKLLKGKERANFATFLSGLYVRSPATLRLFGESLGAGVEVMTNAVTSTRQRFEESMDAYATETGKEISKELRDWMFDFLRDKSRYTLGVHRDSALPAMKFSNELAKIFFNMGWVVARSDQQHLITSDNPVVQHSSQKSKHSLYGDGGFLNQNTFVTVPLSAEYCLEMYCGDDYIRGVVSLDRERARSLNRQRAIFSERYLYSSVRDGGIRALGQKYKDQGLKMKVSGTGALAPVIVKRRIDR